MLHINIFPHLLLKYHLINLFVAEASDDSKHNLGSYGSPEGTSAEFKKIFLIVHFKV